MIAPEPYVVCDRCGYLQFLPDDGHVCAKCGSENVWVFAQIEPARRLQRQIIDRPSGSLF